MTRNPAPYLPPDARSLVAATNFTVTRSGLEGQLLGLTIQREQPELEAQKSALLRQEEELKMQLADLERSLLQNLATSTGGWHTVLGFGSVVVWEDGWADGTGRVILQNVFPPSEPSWCKQHLVLGP